MFAGDLDEENLVHSGSSGGTVEVRAGRQRWDQPGANVSLGFSDAPFFVGDLLACWAAQTF